MEIYNLKNERQTQIDILSGVVGDILDLGNPPTPILPTPTTTGTPTETPQPVASATPTTERTVTVVPAKTLEPSPTWTPSPTLFHTETSTMTATPTATSTSNPTRIATPIEIHTSGTPTVAAAVPGTGGGSSSSVEVNYSQEKVDRSPKHEVMSAQNSSDSSISLDLNLSNVKLDEILDNAFGYNVAYTDEELGQVTMEVGNTSFEGSIAKVLKVYGLPDNARLDIFFTNENGIVRPESTQYNDLMLEDEVLEKFPELSAENKEVTIQDTLVGTILWVLGGLILVVGLAWLRSKSGGRHSELMSTNMGERPENKPLSTRKILRSSTSSVGSIEVGGSRVGSIGIGQAPKDSGILGGARIPDVYWYSNSAD